ncbi:uncharacterized protein LOC128759342 [Synchiropus splendidus]|uniref:uncharacterized protein LOC128759342 n=1 Tax=Synchiropus splendidus TaxID=270530 RepID=UPI00237ECB9D|nr:uncharacterized protein LOC128759342 [Synchiropus splendidus]
MEMEKMPVYRNQILSVTGEILCIDGTRQVLKKIYGDGQGTMQYLTSVLNEWGQFVTTVVVASESEGCYARMARGLMARFERANAPAPKAVRNGAPELYAKCSDQEMMAFLKPHQIRSYVRRITRGVEETASAVDAVIADFKGPAGLDIDGIHLFKSTEAVDSHWLTASRHFGCMQDPPGVPLYVAVKTVVLNGVQLNKYRCRRGSNSLEGLHAHLNNAIPSKRCGIMPFHVYLLAFAVQWNTRMESLRVAGGQGRQTTCTDPRQIQRMNRQAEILFGKEHVPEPNFSAPMPYPDEYGAADEEELLGVEYAVCQSTAFSAKPYYAQKAEEEQSRDEEEDDAQSEEEESPDEGVDLEEDDPLDGVCQTHGTLLKAEQVEEEEEYRPALQDVLMRGRHLHLPGIEEVEALAVLLVQLADGGDCHLVPVDLRQRIVAAAGRLHDHDRSSANFVKRYESKWGYTLFGRCLGADTPESSAAQKTKFGWMRFPQAAQVTEDGRLLYLLVKMLRNRPATSKMTSPTKVTASIRGQYQRIADRVRDDPILGGLQIPLPHVNAKSISTFLRKEEKRANLMATVRPVSKTHRTVVSEEPLPDAPALETSLPPPDRPQVQYQDTHHVTGRRSGEKKRLSLDEPAPELESKRRAAPETDVPTEAAGRPAAATHLPQAVSAAPVLLVVPAQPLAPSIAFPGPSSSKAYVPILPAPAPRARAVLPHKSQKPCAACLVPQCGGQRKRYTPSKDKAAGSSQKIFTFCPATRKSTTPGFQDVVYESYEHFKSVVDQKLQDAMQ